MVCDEFLSLMKNGMACVAASVVTEHVCVGAFLAQKVGNLALSAVSILEIDYDICRKHSCLNLSKNCSPGKQLK